MDNKAYIAGVAMALPPHQVAQEAITETLAGVWQEHDVNARLVQRLHTGAKVKTRHISMPLDELINLRGFGPRNDAFLKIAVDLSERALQQVFDETGVQAHEITAMFSTTVTGIAAPTLDARLMNRLPFSPCMKRLPFFGLGCVAGAAGLARAADYLVGHPRETVVLLAVELCSLTFQETDVSMANIVSSGLFGDGAAAVVLYGKDRVSSKKHMPRIAGSKSFFFPNTERVMGFDITDQGLKIVLSADVPRLAHEKIPGCVDELLAEHSLTRSDITAWIAHPGGPKVMDALETGLGLASKELAISHESLAVAGNLSSASVLMILQKTLEQKQFKPGDTAVLLAMGPAFCAEVVLLRW